MGIININNIEIYEALVGFFITMIIILLKNYILDKKSAYNAVLYSATGWACHFIVRKIVKRQFTETETEKENN